MKYNFPKSLFFLSIVLLVFSSLSFVFLYKKIKENQTVSAQKMEEWQVENQKRNNIKSLEHLVQSVDREKNILDSHFAQSSDIVPFLNMFEKLAPQTKAKAEVMNVSEDSKGLIVQVKALGSFESVYKFLLLLENSPYELEFVSMDMQKIATNDTSGTKSTKTKVPEWSAVFDVKLLSFVK